MWGFAPALSRLGRDLGFTQLVIWGCIVLYMLTLVCDPEGLQFNGFLNFLSPSSRSLFLFGASGALPVFQYGRWWTVLSAGWLHAGLLHIFFNMMWVRQLAPATAEIYGASRMIIIYTIAGIAGFLASSFAPIFLIFLPGFLHPGVFTVGASAPIFGLLGSLIYYGKRGGSSMIGDQAKTWAVLILIMGFIMPGIDNFAHLGGLGGGYLASKVLDPLHPERLDHLVIAFVCLGATALAIIASILTGLRLI